MIGMFKTKWPLLPFLVVVVASFVLGSYLSVFAEGKKNNRSNATISVTGSAVLSVKPDTAEVSLGVETTADTARIAQEKNTELMTNILAKLKETTGEKDKISTVQFSLNPVYRYDKASGSNILEGYRVENHVLVKTYNLNIVGKLIDQAITAGATTVDRITFGLADSSKVKLDALKAATEDAKDRAKAIAVGLGLNLGNAKKASDGNVSVVPLTKQYAATAARDLAAGTPVQEGDVQVSAQVSIDFGTR
jgi:uncharacterized protein YggE